MIECCKQEMVTAGTWYHCEVCGMRLRAHPYGKDQAILSELVIEEVHSNMMTWKEFHAIFHELWRAGYYGDYEPKLPEWWVS